MKKKLIIFGAGDIAQLANYYFENDSDYQVEAFSVDSHFLASNSFEGKPLVSFQKLTDIYPPKRYDVFIALSYKNLNQVRKEKYVQAKLKGYSVANYISTKCTYLSQFKPGDNCFILENNTIQPFVKIGNNVTLWSGNHIGHHSVIEDHNFISSHVVVSGHCIIEPHCFVGVNATIHNNVTVKTRNIIGAGAIITRNTKPEEVYTPARSSVFRKKSSEINL